MAFSDWSTTAINNSAKPGIDWSEGMLPSGVNNSARQMMADLATWGANATSVTVRYSSTVGASLSSTGHAFQVGPTTGSNLIISTNDVMSRNNGAVDGLGLNILGGQVGIGAGAFSLGAAIYVGASNGACNLNQLKIIRNFNSNDVIVATDGGQIIRSNTSGNRTLTIQPDSTVALPNQTSIEIWADGGGSVTIARGTGVTLSFGGTNADRVLSAGRTVIVKVSANTWMVAS